MPKLDALPNEILSLVTNHLEHPKDVTSLSQTGRRLNAFVKLDGWKAYLKGRFGVVGFDADAQNAVHGLTTLYRSWERKGFVARYLEPVKTTSLNIWRSQPWQGLQSQTMGYRPSIDSYEETRHGWADRREVLAWTAGTQIALRVRDTGSKSTEKSRKAAEDIELNEYKHAVSWYSYQVPEGQEGQDDITALKLLRPHQRNEKFECFAFGTASGQLKLLRSETDTQTLSVQSYNTNRRSVGSISISPNEVPFMSATLGDDTLALFSIHSYEESKKEEAALSKVRPSTSRASTGIGRVWSCNFLSQETVAVGMGPTYEPIQIFEITPTGFSAEPSRRICLDPKSWGEDRIEQPSGTRGNTSVYTIVPLHDASSGTAQACHLFLSGGYDGIVRLHDLRSPHGFETMYWDVTNDSSIYSLATQGLERVVAGTSMHSMLKVFDLRMSAAHAYHSAPFSSQKQSKTPPRRRDYTSNEIVRDAVTHSGALTMSGGWNLFLHPRNQRKYIPRRTRGRVEDSPVYSLSIPSPTSTLLYAGLEGSVMGLDFHSVTDNHPGPLHYDAVVRYPNSDTIDTKSSYDPHENLLNFGMYEQGNEQAVDMRLMIQDWLGPELERKVGGKEASRFAGLDDRWSDPSAGRERWSRGQEPPTRGRGGHRRGRGGRGRRGT